MFEKINKVMLYVNDPAKTAQFWIEKLGFMKKSETTSGGIVQTEISPALNSQTTIVLFDRAVIHKMEPELDMGLPSLMFATKNLQALHSELKSKGVTVGEIVTYGGSSNFNFADNENNYFAVEQA